MMIPIKFDMQQTENIGFLLPIVKCLLADPHFSTDFLHSGACLGLLDRKSDLRFKISNSTPNSLLFKYSSFWG